MPGRSFAAIAGGLVLALATFGAAPAGAAMPRAPVPLAQVAPAPAALIDVQYRRHHRDWRRHWHRHRVRRCHIERRLVWRHGRRVWRPVKVCHRRWR
jgi:hypothetical protein